MQSEFQIERPAATHKWGIKLKFDQPGGGGTYTQEMLTDALGAVRTKARCSFLDVALAVDATNQCNAPRAAGSSHGMSPDNAGLM